MHTQKRSFETYVVDLLEDIDIQSRNSFGLTQMAFQAEDFDEHYGLVQPEQLVVVRSYSDDADDRILTELKPRFIIMFEPNLDFVRRIEVYRSSNPGLSVRLYVEIWDTSAEEDMYLAELRREKESFEQLIRERAVSIFDLLHFCPLMTTISEHGVGTTGKT